MPTSEDNWPRITLVTPSFNQGKFLEQTIRSIHDQKYPNLEHIVIDGGSTDDSVKILQKYEKFFSYWISEPDRGQTHAINKGLKLATGEIFNWVNSDDCLTPGSLFEIARLWKVFCPHILVGAAQEEDLRNQQTHHHSAKISKNIGKLLRCWELVIPQPSTFLHCESVKRYGGMREDLHLRFDWEFYLRLRLEIGDALKIIQTPRVLSKILVHPDCKSARSEKAFQNETLRIWKENLPKLNFWNRLLALRCMDQFRCQTSTNKIRQRNGAGKMLFQSAWRHPNYLTFRFYWGAVRKTLVS